MGVSFVHFLFVVVVVGFGTKYPSTRDAIQQIQAMRHHLVDPRNKEYNVPKRLSLTSPYSPSEGEAKERDTLWGERFPSLSAYEVHAAGFL